MTKKNTVKVIDMPRLSRIAETRQIIETTYMVEKSEKITVEFETSRHVVIWKSACNEIWYYNHYYNIFVNTLTENCFYPTTQKAFEAIVENHKAYKLEQEKNPTKGGDPFRRARVGYLTTAVSITDV